MSRPHQSGKIHILGVDLKEAQARLMDDDATIVSLLRDFVDNALATESLRSEPSDEQSLITLLRALHKIRGGAANLAARSVESAATATENASKALLESPLSPQANGSLREEVTRHLGQLRCALNDLSEALRTAETCIDSAPQPSHDASASEIPSQAQVEEVKTSTLLIIDDSDSMRFHLKAILKEEFPGMNVIEAASGLEGFKRLAADKPDLALCDLQMETFDGLKVLDLRATRPELLEIPVLMLTAEHEANQKVEALNRGAATF